VNITRDLDHHPEPLVQGVGREIILSDAHGVVTATIETYQAIAVLQGLDPLGKPRQG
jgi:hypothetical protein